MDAQNRLTELQEKLQQLKKEERDLSTKMSINKKDQAVICREMWLMGNGLNIGDTVTFQENGYGGVKYTGVLIRLDTDRINNIFPVIAITKRDGTAGTREKVIEANDQKTLKKINK
jgi:hypothetical protein